MKLISLIGITLCLLIVFNSYGQTSVNISNTPITLSANQEILYYDSGGANGNYANNESFTQTFTAPAGYKLYIIFESFVTESSEDCNNYDYMRVYDGANTSSPALIGRGQNACTNNDLYTNVYYRTTGNMLTVNWHSDTGSNAAGWKARIGCRQQNEITCGVKEYGVLSGGSANGFNSTIYSNGNTEYKNKYGKISYFFTPSVSGLYKITGKEGNGVLDQGDPEFVVVYNNINYFLNGDGGTAVFDFNLNAGTTYEIFITHCNTSANNQYNLWVEANFNTYTAFNAYSGATSINYNCTNPSANVVQTIKTASNPSGGAITYTSSNPAIASVNATTGQITAHSLGTVTITATSQATGCFASSSATYNFTVNAPTLTAPTTDAATKYSCSGDDVTLISTNVNSNLLWLSTTNIREVRCNSTDVFKNPASVAYTTQNEGGQTYVKLQPNSASTPNDPYIRFNNWESLDASKLQYVHFRYKIVGWTGNTSCQFYWNAEHEDRHVDIPIIADGRWHTKIANMNDPSLPHGAELWDGTINALRFDPVTTAELYNNNGYMLIDYIAFRDAKYGNNAQVSGDLAPITYQAFASCASLDDYFAANAGSGYTVIQKEDKPEVNIQVTPNTALQCINTATEIQFQPQMLSLGSPQNFTTVGESTYTVPAGVTKLQLEVWGAAGGNYTGVSSSIGGKGGYSKGYVSVTQGQTIYVYVGGVGQSGTGNLSGGYNGGGNTSNYGGAGGGATDIRIGGYAQADRVIVAGGGGGGGGGYKSRTGGCGGGRDGVKGDDGSNTGGYGGSQNAGGSNNNPGSLGQGGTASEGGGGGGGYYGGASGNPSGDYESAGGGGSGYIGGVTNGQTIAGNATMPNPAGGTMTGREGNGYARITPYVMANTNWTGYTTNWEITGTTGTQNASTRQYTVTPTQANNSYTFTSTDQTTGCVFSKTYEIANMSAENIVGTNLEQVCVGNAASLTASFDGAEIKWYDNSSASGSPLAYGNNFNTPAIFGNTTYYAQAVINEEAVIDVNKTVVNFEYTGGEQTWTVPEGVTELQLEVWGGEGGGYEEYTNGSLTSKYENGGKGGYSICTVNVASGQELHVNVGGRGMNAVMKYTVTGGSSGTTTSSSHTAGKGGYNGGGDNSWYGGPGGGATHIAFVGGELSTLSSQRDKVLLVAGAGGGSGYSGRTGGYGGGNVGGQGQEGKKNLIGDTMNPGGGGGSQGAGGTSPTASGVGFFGGAADMNINGGGGGWYGGGHGTSGNQDTGGGGGSGYVINNSSVYFVPGSTNSTIAGNATMPDPAGGNMTGNAGDGYARITYYKQISSARNCQSIPKPVAVNIKQPTEEVANGDYVWTGATNTTWATTTNWLKWNGATYVTVAVQPQAESNVLITNSNLCVSNFPNGANTNIKNLTIGNNASLNLGTNNLQVANMNLNANGTFNGGSGTLSVKGNFANNGTFNAGTGTVTFNGTTAQTLSGNAVSFYNFTMNNAAGLTINAEPTINNSATFTNGNVESNMTFAQNASSTSNAGSYLIGKVTKTGSGSAFTFPTGTSVLYAPLTANVSNGSTVKVAYVHDGDDGEPFFSPVTYNDATGNMDPGLHHVSQRENWSFEGNGTLSNITMSWYGGQDKHIVQDLSDPNWEAPTFSDIESSVVVAYAYYDGENSSQWKIAEGGLSHLGNINEGSISLNGSIQVTGSTERPEEVVRALVLPRLIVTFGSRYYSDGARVILPISLLTFEGKCDGTSAELFWATASETNNELFVIEKSADATNFIEIARIAGAGSSIEEQHYSYTDANVLGGNNYYRLRQVDYDGMSTTSDIISLNCADDTNIAQPTITAYPNPFKDDITIVIANMDEEYSLEIYNELGQLVNNHTDYRTVSHELHLSDLPNGTYFVRVTSANSVLVEKIVKQ